MIRGAGRLTKRMDERAQHGVDDRVRDGRQLMAQPDSTAGRELVVRFGWFALDLPTWLVHGLPAEGQTL